MKKEDVKMPGGPSNDSEEKKHDNDAENKVR
jgi:hypothetical protein